MTLRDDVTRVLTRTGASAGDLAAAQAAIAAGDPRLLALLQAQRPAAPAVIAAFDGFVRVEAAALVLGARPIDGAVGLEPIRRTHSEPSGGVLCHARGHDGPIMRYPLRGREVQVGDGAAVAAGEALTAGDVDLHDVLLVFGVAEVRARMIAQMAACGLSGAVAAVLVEPMFTLVRIVEPGDGGLEPGARVSEDRWNRLLGEAVQRCLHGAADDGAPLPAELAALLALTPAEAFSRWWQDGLATAWDGLLRPNFPVAEPALTGYPSLARHRDP